MSNGDPRDGFFYPTVTIMVDSNNLETCQLASQCFPSSEKRDAEVQIYIHPAPMVYSVSTLLSCFVNETLHVISDNVVF